MRDKTAEEVAWLERLGKFQKMSQFEMASQTAPVREVDGSVRICADYTVTKNKIDI